MVVESRSVKRNAKNARGLGSKSCASYFRFARFNTFPLYYPRAWHRLIFGVPSFIQNIENGTRTLCMCYRVKWWLQLENKMTRVPWWIHEKDVMFAMSRASNGGPTEGTQALLRHTFLDQTQPVLAYITGVIFSCFQASGGKRGASLRSWRDKWECCSLPRAQESRQLRRLTRSERGAPDTLDGGRHRKNSAIYFFLRLSSCACLALFTHFTLTFARLKSLKTWNVSSSIMHGSIWPVTIPRG